jgi:YceI-like domain
MTDTTSGALPDLRAGSFTVSPAGSRIGFSTRNLIGMTAAGTRPEMDFSSTSITAAGDAVTITGLLTVRDQTRRITLAGRHTGTTPGGGHGFEVGGVVNPRDIGITHPAIKQPVTIQITAGLVPA